MLELVPDSGGDSPTVRSSHAAVCIEHGGDGPQLVISGGLDAGDKALNDVWIMDVQSGRWKKVIHALAINEKVISLCEYIRECGINLYMGLQLLSPTNDRHSFSEPKQLYPIQTFACSEHHI